jgi:hypothetical protein
MKPTILTQKNVCAFLSLIMALTILWAARAEAKSDTVSVVAPMKSVGSVEGVQEEVPAFDLDFSDIKEMPTITLVNKYGEVVAEFYGTKSELEKRFHEIIEKGDFMTAVGKQEYYLVR